MRKLIDTRTIFGIGSGRADIYGDGETFVVEVVCNKGTASVALTDEKEAWGCFMHPFAQHLTIPGSEAATTRELTPEEYGLLEALGAVEADSSDSVVSA